MTPPTNQTVWQRRYFVGAELIRIDDGVEQRYTLGEIIDRPIITTSTALYLTLVIAIIAVAFWQMVRAGVL